MMNFKKQPPIEQVRFAQADKFVANGYAVAPTPFGHAMPLGPWVAIYRYHEAQRGAFNDQGVSILLGAKPFASGADSEQARSTWCVAIKVKTHDKTLAKAVDALIAEHRVWRDGVETKHAPVRCTEGKLDTVRIFALADGEQPFSITRTDRRYQLPKDTKGWHGVEVLSDCQQFVHSGLDASDAPYGTGIDPNGAPFYWRDGVDLTQVRRSELPVMTRSTADALRSAIEDLIASHGGMW